MTNNNYQSQVKEILGEIKNDFISVMCRVCFDELNDVESFTNYIISNPAMLDVLGVDSYVKIISKKPFSHILTVNLIQHLKIITVCKDIKADSANKEWLDKYRLKNIVVLAKSLYEIHSKYVPSNWYDELIDLDINLNKYISETITFPKIDFSSLYKPMVSIDILDNLNPVNNN